MLQRNPVNTVSEVLFKLVRIICLGLTSSSSRFLILSFQLERVIFCTCVKDNLQLIYLRDFLFLLDLLLHTQIFLAN